MTEPQAKQLRILALDTAQEDLTVAALDGAALLADAAAHVGSRHAEEILSMTARVLDAAGLKKTDIDLIAFGAGPGAFTGLRVACGVAQGLAWALERPVASVCNLEVLALGCARALALPAGVRIAAVHDARMNECYAAVYETTDRLRLKEVAAPALLKPEAVCEYMREMGASILCGSAKPVYEAVTLPEGAQYAEGVKASAALIGEIAAQMAASGQTTAASAAAPLYVRNRVALTIDERARGERL